MNILTRRIVTLAVALTAMVALCAQTTEIWIFTHTQNGVDKNIVISNIDSITFSSYTAPTGDGVEINGVTWATRNVDAPGTFVENSYEAGMFYQWNRATGWSSTDPLVDHNGGTAWDATVATGDTWEASNNVCPTGWRVPSKEEFESLIAAGYAIAEEEGVAGTLFGSGTNRIFLPKAGGRWDWMDGGLTGVGSEGHYWTDASVAGSSDNAYAVELYNAGANIYDFIGKSCAFSIRCVKAEEEAEQFDVTYETPANGIITVTAAGESVANGTSVAEGTELTITATADDGYELETLTVNGEDFTSGSVYTVIADVVIEVAFIAVSDDITCNTLAGITVYGNGNTVYIENKSSVSLNCVQIADMFGRVVYRKDAMNGVSSIPVDGANGIYIVKLVSDDNRMLSTKVYLAK
jgi:uncharacterized protein (TIGR02145 family)